MNVDELMQAIAYTFRDFLQISAKKYNLEDSDLLKNIKISVVNTSIIVDTPDYLQWVEFGRKAGSGKGHWVPIASLLPWMKKKRIAVGKENKVVFAIQRAIYKNGIKFGVKGRPFFSEAVEETEKETTELLAISFKDMIENDLKKLII